MTISDPHAYCASLWDWSFLDDCFAFRIKVSDIDGLAHNKDRQVLLQEGHVHRLGHWLLFETKGDGVLIPLGQARSHRDLVCVHFTIVYLWGPPNAPTAMQIWKEKRPHPEQIIRPVTLEHIRRFVKGWFAYANAHPVEHLPLFRHSSNLRDQRP
jgi:hypothetical protein